MKDKPKGQITRVTTHHPQPQKTEKHNKEEHRPNGRKAPLPTTNTRRQESKAKRKTGHKGIITQATTHPPPTTNTERQRNNARRNTDQRV